MRVLFIDGLNRSFCKDMEHLPRIGDSVALQDRTTMIVTNVLWFPENLNIVYDAAEVVITLKSR